MSDKDSNKHGAKTTVLFSKLSHELKKKEKKKGKNHTHFGLL